MTSDQKDAIAGVLISQKFTKGQNIVNEGDQADSFYIIKEVSNKSTMLIFRVQFQFSRVERNFVKCIRVTLSVSKLSITIL